VEAASDPTSVVAPAAEPAPTAAVTSNAPVAAQGNADVSLPRWKGQEPVVETLKPAVGEP
jgi:hypothetical protein